MLAVVHHMCRLFRGGRHPRPDPLLCVAVHAAAAAAAAATGAQLASPPPPPIRLQTRVCGGIFCYFFVLFFYSWRVFSEIWAGEAGGRSGPSLLMHSSLFSLEQ